MGCAVAVALLIVPAIIVAYARNNPMWLLIAPASGVVALIVLLALPVKSKRIVTPQEWAKELEPHLLGTDGPSDWDDATRIGLADPRLDALRTKLRKFDMSSDERRKELESIIAGLKRGEIPDASDK